MDLERLHLLLLLHRLNHLKFDYMYFLFHHRYLEEDLQGECFQNHLVLLVSYHHHLRQSHHRVLEQDLY